MTDIDDGFPSDAPELPTQKVNAKPFGYSKSRELANREEALRTMTRQQAFDNGYLTVKDLDDEELRYGRCRDVSGHIPKDGRKTVLLPKDQFDAMIAEHEMRFRQKLRQNLDDMLEIMVGIAKDNTVEPRDRFEAAKYLFERTAGKTAETVNVNVRQAPWEEMLTDVSGIGAISRSEHRRMQSEGYSAGVIDVEVVDEDPVPSEGLPFSGQSSSVESVVQVHQPRSGEPGTEAAAPTRTIRPDGTGAVPEHGRAEPGPDREEVQQGQVGPPGGDYTRSAHDTPKRPLVRKEPNGPEPSFERDPAKPSVGPDAWARVEVDEPDPVTQYGSRRTEAKGYADQVREAQALAARRKESKDRIRNATKQRKIARATGTDAITDEITGASVDEDGKLTFE